MKRDPTTGRRPRQDWLALWCWRDEYTEAVAKVLDERGLAYERSKARLWNGAALSLRVPLEVYKLASDFRADPAWRSDAGLADYLRRRLGEGGL